MAVVTREVAERCCDRCGARLSAKRVKELDKGADMAERILFAHARSPAPVEDIPDLCKPCVRSVRALGERIAHPRRKAGSEEPEK